MSKKNDDKWLQIGNYLIGVEKNSNGTRMCARTVGGDWSVRWGEGTLMFSVLLRLGDDDTCHPYLHALLTLQYVATNYPHDMVSIIERGDLPVINGFCKLMEEQTAFEVSVKEKTTDKEDAEALREVGEMHDIMAELERLDAETDKTEDGGDGE